jgi:fumarylacetoacetase
MTPPPLDHTHDPHVISWVASANDASNEFPIQNLPLASAILPDGSTGVVVGIGHFALPLRTLAEIPHEVDACSPQLRDALVGRDMASLFALSASDRTRVRHMLHRLLRADVPEALQQSLSSHLIPLNELRYALPARIPNYTDFYASIHHATNVGRLFRPDKPLLPNYKYLPIAYHGRASTVMADGSDVIRPMGQIVDSAGEEPCFKPSRQLDFEVELGVWIAEGSDQGSHVTMDNAARKFFGCSLLNDWSARDMQTWEYQPLGPFLSKNFHTSISPWVITAEALAPFRVKAFERQAGDPPLLQHLHHPGDQAGGGLAVQFGLHLRTPAMRKQELAATLLTCSNFRDAYWTITQMITHHASNGCRLEAGDLLGSGTISSNDSTQVGSLLELTRGGKVPITLPSGEVRTYLEDGDEVVLHGWCVAEGFRSIGFGTCAGLVTPARDCAPRG